MGYGLAVEVTSLARGHFSADSL